MTSNPCGIARIEHQASLVDGKVKVHGHSRVGASHSFLVRVPDMTSKFENKTDLRAPLRSQITASP